MYKINILLKYFRVVHILIRKLKNLAFMLFQYGEKKEFFFDKLVQPQTGGSIESIGPTGCASRADPRSIE